MEKDIRGDFGGLKKGKRGSGYSSRERSPEASPGIFVYGKKTENGPDGKKVTVTVKEVIPDTTAQIFWLKNRRPDVWRDKQEIEHGGKIGGVTIVNDIPKPDTS